MAGRLSITKELWFKISECLHSAGLRGSLGSCPGAGQAVGVPASMRVPLKVSRSTMAAQSRGS